MNNPLATHRVSAYIVTVSPVAASRPERNRGEQSNLRHEKKTRLLRVQTPREDRMVASPDSHLLRARTIAGTSLFGDPLLLVIPEDFSRVSTDKEYGFPIKALGNDTSGEWIGTDACRRRLGVIARISKRFPT